MIRIQTAFPACLYTIFLSLAIGMAACQSHQAPQVTLGSQPSPTDLRIVDNPSGGQFAYGSLTGQGTKADAVVYMLHKVHEHFGDKPQIGKFFQSRDGSSLATFFTLNAKAMGGKPVAGLVIVSMPGKSAAQVAVLYDYANRFVSTEPAMLKSLSAAWQGSASPSGHSEPQDQAPAAPRGGPEQIYPATGGDRSAIINLPPDWHLTSVAGGSLFVEGNHGEMVGLQVVYQQIINPQSPLAQGLMSGPMASRGPKVVCPLVRDLFADYVCVINQVRRNNGKSQGTFNLTSSQPQPGGGQIPPIATIYTVDFHDGMGPRNGSARLDLIGSPGATWALGVSASNIPQKYADAEAATLKAVVASYRRNERVISAENAANMDRIRQQGERNRIQTEVINDRREAGKQAYEIHRQDLNQRSSDDDQHNANIDWGSKLTQDYILDRSVVKDNDYDERGTVNNKFADSLVKANPDRFEIVQNQDLIRGRDY